jgi:hypothetical protein
MSGVRPDEPSAVEVLPPTAGLATVSGVKPDMLLAVQLAIVSGVKPDMLPAVALLRLFTGLAIVSGVKPDTLAADWTVRCVAVMVSDPMSGGGLGSRVCRRASDWTVRCAAVMVSDPMIDGGLDSGVKSFLALSLNFDSSASADLKVIMLRCAPTATM